MKRFLLPVLSAILPATAFLLSAGHAAAVCDPFDTRLCTDGPAYQAGGIARVSYADDRYRLGGVGTAAPLGGPAGFGGGYGQAGPAEGSQ